MKVDSMSLLKERKGRADSGMWVDGGVIPQCVRAFVLSLIDTLLSCYMYLL